MKMIPPFYLDELNNKKNRKSLEKIIEDDNKINHQKKLVKKILKKNCRKIDFKDNTNDEFLVQ